MEGILIRNAPIIIYGLVMLVVAVITSAALRKRLRERARLALGREIEDPEMTSINTWMEVEGREEEQRCQERLRCLPTPVSPPPTLADVSPPLYLPPPHLLRTKLANRLFRLSNLTFRVTSLRLRGDSHLGRNCHNDMN